MPEERTLLNAFHFRVTFKGLEKSSDADTRFQSVSGLKALAGITDTISDPDKKRIAATLFNPVVLKRAIDNRESPLRNWVLQSLNEPSRKALKEMRIELLNEEHKPQLVFLLRKITAAGWELSELNAEKSELLMESISLNYESIEVIKG